ncbi:hypothetical protein [Deinococcus budaensis]|uniref:Uncharacterized protein n=1 Tax=Deinococcus budaensis TaxID=1665626 RepID=A0A7W8LQ49_9DEIO|nr:hypothetical protein [Deinococcus budaensis]MBB5234468.1 hypothetical protein [Deinococcus budaensis]
MTAPAPLSISERLEAEIALTAADLKMSEEVYKRRLKLWDRLASQRTGLDKTSEQHFQFVLSLAAAAWIAELLRDAEKFRVEGQVEEARDLRIRIARLEKIEAAARVATLPAAEPMATPGSANPTPLLMAWGVDGGEP